MFNLGYKEVIVNSDSDITATGTVTAGTNILAVDGVCNLEDTELASITKVPSVPGVKGMAELAQHSVLTGAADGDIITATFRLKSVGNERISSNLYPYGETKSIIFKEQSSATEVGLAQAYLKLVEGNNWEDLGYTIAIESGSGIGQITALDEGVSVVDLVLTKTETGEVVTTGITYTEGSIGVGLGSQLEAEVKNATFDNIDPYGVRFGGSGIVDVRGKYTQYIISTSDANGWASHASTGYGLNAGDSNKEPRMLVLWVNEVSAGTSITDIDAMMV